MYYPRVNALPLVYLDSLVKHLGELLHLLQADPNEGCLGIGAVAQSVNKACTQRNHVLQRPAELHSHRIVDELHAEVGRVKQHLQLLCVVANAVSRHHTFGRHAPQRGLRKLARSNLVGDVRSADDGAVDVQLVVNHSRDEAETAVLVMVHSLDAGDGICVRTNVVLYLVQRLGEKLR